MTSKNIYHRRQVAETSAKSCWICFKPSSVVLITPDSDDWFHICSGHLNDRSFAVAKDAVDEEKLKREQAIEQEIEAVKKEYEEKMKNKKQQKKKGKDEDKKKAETVEDGEKAKDEKIKELEEKKSAEEKATTVPRIFELSRHFYQMRLQKKHQASIAKRNMERLRNPSSFPSAPTGDP